MNYNKLIISNYNTNYNNYKILLRKQKILEQKN